MSDRSTMTYNGLCPPLSDVVRQFPAHTLTVKAHPTVPDVAQATITSYGEHNAATVAKVLIDLGWAFVETKPEGRDSQLGTRKRLAYITCSL